jgi:hypothetical protein
MLAAVDWDSLVPAGAFILGVAFGTLAVIRIVKAVVTIFDERPGGRRDRRSITDRVDPGDED